MARRMEEKERERLRDEEARAKAAAQEADCSRGQSRSMALTPERSQVSLPSGLLTPLLKRHQDLDAELRNRLKELERKVYVPDPFKAPAIPHALHSSLVVSLR